MVANTCGVISVYLIGCGLLWGRICYEKDEPNHHAHPNTAGGLSIDHFVNTLFYIDVFAPILCTYWPMPLQASVKP